MKSVVVYTHRSSFVASDIELLNAKEYQFNNNKLAMPLSFIKQFFHFLFHAYDRYYIWFCDYHALIPTLFAKLYGGRSIVIVGGYDAMSYPSLNYGVFLKKNLRQLFVRITYKICNVIAPVHATLALLIDKHSGILRYMRLNQNKFHVIPTAYDPEKWPLSQGKREIDFLTVALANNKQTYFRKGIDRFEVLARLYPQYKFMVIGQTYINRENIPNLTVLPAMDQKELAVYYGKSKFYCQLSRAEGLPNILMEAMLCGCVPICTRINGMRDVLYKAPAIQYGVLNFEQEIERIMPFANLRLGVRDFVVSNYPLADRFAKLVTV